MEFTTNYNLDTVFYHVKGEKVTFVTVNNIFTSAVGQKVFYELQGAGGVETFSEAELDEAIQNKSMLRNMDEVREFFQQTVDKKSLCFGEGQP